MYMPTNNVRHLRRKTRLGEIDPQLVAAAAGAAQGAQGASGQPSGGGGIPMPGGSGGSKISVPVSTQVTTAVSPVFNISTGGGGPVTQSGSTVQSASPSVANMMNDTPPGQPGYTGPGSYGSGMPLPGDSILGQGTLPVDYASAYDSTSGPLYNVGGQSGGIGKWLILGGAALALFLLFKPGAKTEIRRIVTGKKSRKRARK